MIPKEVMYGIIIITLMIFLQAVESGKVTRHLRSKVALENTTTTFTCSGTGENAYVNIDVVGAEEIRWKDLPKCIPERHINVTGSGNSSSEHSFIIEILAEISNNETEIWCTFVGDYNSKTGPAVLYVAKDKLGEVKEFQEPKLSCNKTSITITWSPPWSHLINNYTVTVTNMSSDVQTVNYLHNNETTWTMYRTHNHATQCHKLELFVTAFTDVGEATSKVIETGFPIELEVVYDEDVIVEVFLKQNNRIKAEIHFEAPIYCSFVQEILYNYTIFKDGHSNNTKHYEPISAGPGLDSEDFIEREGNYTLEITYWDAKSSVDEVTITKHFKTNFTISTKTDPVMCSTNNTATHSLPSGAEIILITLGGILAIFCILAVCIIIFLICSLKSLRKKQRQFVSYAAETAEDIQPSPRGRSKTMFSSSCSTFRPLKRERKLSVPQVMATNPIYEGTSPLYEYLPDSKDMKSLGQGRNELEIPKEIPIPPKRSLDSPGVKSGVELSIDKCTHKRRNEADTNDQYVPMQSTRYAKSPTIKQENDGHCKQKDMKTVEVHVNNKELSESKDNETFQQIEKI